VEGLSDTVGGEQASFCLFVAVTDKTETTPISKPLYQPFSTVPTFEFPLPVSTDKSLFVMG